MKIKDKPKAILIGIFIMLIIIGGFRNTRIGVTVGDKFLVEREDGYFRSGNHEIRMIKGEGFTNFQMVLHGENRTAALRWSRSDALFDIEQDYATLTFDDGTVIEGTWFSDDMLLDKDGLPLGWSSGFMSADGDTVRVISNEELSNVLCKLDLGKTEQSGSIGIVLVGGLIYILGALSFLYPEKVHFFGNRWRYKNAELSDDGIFMEKFGGIIGMVIGAFFMINLAGLI